MNQADSGMGRVQNTRWTHGVFRMAARVWMYTLMMALLAVLLLPMLLSSSPLLRVPLNLLVLLGGCALAFADAASRGQKETAHARLLAHRVRDRGKTPDERDIEKCYHPARGALAALIAVIPFLAIAIPVSVLARPYTYTLQDIPSWLNGLGRADVDAPLAFYSVNAQMMPIDYLRPLVRILMMPIANIFGSFGDGAALLQDRLSPLLVLILPVVYAVGYLRGPAVDTKILLRNEEAKRLHLKKIARKKKRERQRAQGQRSSKGPERLI